MEVGRILEELGEEKLRSEHSVRKRLFSIKMYMEKVYVCVRMHMHACVRITFMVNDDKIYPHLQWLLQSL